MTNLKSTTYYWIGAAAVLAVGVILYLMGQPAICECGFVKLWHGDPVSAQNSKHLTDWYTFSHIIHGFIFFWIINWLAPDWPIGLKLLAAILPEAAWEIFENTDFIIEYYRQNTISVEYRGDSAINSMADIASMVIGFGLAAWLPWWVVLLILIGMEAFTFHFIRDNLTLNILMLIHPFEFISEWQSSG